MDRTGYKVKFDFSKLYGADVEKREINGIMEDVLVIPMRLNGMYFSKKAGAKGVYMYGRAYPSDVNPFNQSHYIISTPPEKVQDELESLGHRRKNVFGYLSTLFLTQQRKDAKSHQRRLDNILGQDF